MEADAEPPLNRWHEEAPLRRSILRDSSVFFRRNESPLEEGGAETKGSMSRIGISRVGRRARNGHKSHGPLVLMGLQREGVITGDEDGVCMAGGVCVCPHLLPDSP